MTWTTICFSERINISLPFSNESIHYQTKVTWGAHWNENKYSICAAECNLFSSQFEAVCASGRKWQEKLQDNSSPAFIQTLCKFLNSALIFIGIFPPLYFLLFSCFSIHAFESLVLSSYSQVQLLHVWLFA